MVSSAVSDLLWSQFQSLAQLSVAMNGAFSAIGGFLSRDIAQEEADLTRIIRVIETECGKGRTYNLTSKGLDVLLVTKALLAEARYLDNLHAATLSFAIRPLCLIGAVLGILLLIKSSYNYTEKIDQPYLWLLYICNVPFFLGILVTIITSLLVYFRVIKPKAEITKITN
jgi:hypothetical protein